MPLKVSVLFDVESEKSVYHCLQIIIHPKMSVWFDMNLENFGLIWWQLSENVSIGWHR